MPLRYQKPVCTQSFEEAVRLILDAVSPQESESYHCSIPLAGSVPWTYRLRGAPLVTTTRPWMDLPFVQQTADPVRH
jgi:hypothetical protein